LSADDRFSAAQRAAGGAAPAARSREHRVAHDHRARDRGGGIPRWRAVLDIMRLDDAEVLRRIARGGSAGAGNVSDGAGAGAAPDF
jgi:hypothetical protein